MNDRITPKDRNTIKGNLRRAFARSELHKAVLNEAVVQWSDPARPRVKTWCQCNVCKRPEARSYCVVDHVLPVIPVDSSFEALGADATIERLWCDKANLQCICPECHDIKTKAEKAERKKFAPPRVPRKKKVCVKT